ncbi:MAG: potassium channel family protein [Acidimicrobiales bacterium]
MSDPEDEMTTHHAKKPESVSELAHDHAFKLLGVATLSLLVLATVVYKVLEDWSWVDSVYFSTVAVTTVGFGDLAPTTDGSKLFTIFYLFSGVGLITTFLNERFRHLSESRERRRASGSGS